MTSPLIVIGIDPGRSGALVAITGNPEAPKVVSYTRAEEYYPPKAELNATAWGRVLSAFSARANVVAYIEAPGYRPGESTQSTATTARAYGAMVALLQFLGIPFHEVQARKWTKALGVDLPKKADGSQPTTKEKKEKHLEVVERVIPTLPYRTPRGAIEDGIGDAACIALYGLKLATRSNQ